MLKAVLVAALLSMSSAAFAWSEVTISLADPSGRQVEGEARTGLMTGYFCSDRPSAETLSQYMGGEKKVLAEGLAMALRQCVADVRQVTGIFPENEKFPVVFVRMLADLQSSSYYVPGLIAEERQQDARLE